MMRHESMRRPGGGGFVVPALWAAAIEARRAEYQAEKDASRERRRADESALWLDELRTAVTRLSATVGHGWDVQSRFIVTTDGVRLDPAAALAEVVAVAAAWHDAMLDPARQPAAIGG